MKRSLAQNVLFVNSLLDGYTCTLTDNGIHCTSDTGMSDREWQYFAVCIKDYFGRRFKEIFHQINYKHKTFTIYIEWGKLKRDRPKPSEVIKCLNDLFIEANLNQPEEEILQELKNNPNPQFEKYLIYIKQLNQRYAKEL